MLRAVAVLGILIFTIMQETETLPSRLILHQSLSGIARHFPASISFFELYGMDYSCHGKQTFEEACRKAGYPEDVLVAELRKSALAESGYVNHFDPELAGAGAVIRYILDIHHEYIYSMIPVLEHHLQQTAETHGDRFPELGSLARLFLELKEELDQHLMKEEVMLFPCIVSLEQEFLCMDRDVPPSSPFISRPIRMMEYDHESFGEILDEIRNISRTYTASAASSVEIRQTCLELQQLETDLHRHFHLENNILFPKAMALEKLYLSKNEIQVTIR